MPWPMSQDYNEAIQDAAQCFADPELKRGEAVCNALGLPVPCSGNFADVYAVQSGPRKWAVKCFTREIPGLQERYVQISKYLAQVQLPFMVDFQFLEQGIRVRGQWFPVLKMQWVEGFPLNTFVRDNLDKPPVLQTLCQIWLKLAQRLREANLAHCDLQHGNVLLVPGSKAGSVGIKLVDYDGMCVPALEFLKTIELGHANYQHPQRLKEGTYGLQTDRFAHLVIYTALRALAVSGKALWDKYDNGDNLLFKQPDFEAPGKSALFAELLQSKDAEVQKLTRALATAAQKPISQVPLLEELVEAKPTTKVQPAAPTGTKKGVASGPGGANLFAAATGDSGMAADRRPTKAVRKKSYAGLAMVGGLGAALLGGVVLIAAMSTSTAKKNEAVAEGHKTQASPLVRAVPRATFLDRPETKPQTRPDSKADPKIDPEQPPKVEPSTDRYPALDGVWQEGPEGNRIRVAIVQQAEKFTADCAYQHPQHGEIRWRMTGTVTKEGKITGQLVHTKAPAEWVNQSRTGLLAADGETITGRAAFERGGGHDFVWQRLPNRERQVAERALTLGGRVQLLLLDSGRREEFIPGQPLPAGAFRVEGLLLSENRRITDKVLAELIIPLQGVRILHLHNTPVTDAGLTCLREQNALMELYLDGTKVTDAGLEHLRPLTGLEVLHLHQLPISDAGIKRLEPLQKLRALALYGTRVTDAGLTALPSLPELAVVNLNHTAVSDAGLAVLTKLLKLRSLHVQKTRVTEAGLQHIRALTDLEELDLSQLPITDVGLRQLDDLKHLRRLWIWGTKITDATLRHLVTHHPQLEGLAVDGTAITDAGVAQLKGLQNLNALFIGESVVTNAVVEHLKALPNLKSLRFTRSKITTEVVRRELPQCSILP